MPTSIEQYQEINKKLRAEKNAIRKQYSKVVAESTIKSTAIRKLEREAVALSHRVRGEESMRLTIASKLKNIQSIVNQHIHDLGSDLGSKRSNAVKGLRVLLEVKH